MLSKDIIEIDEELENTVSHRFRENSDIAFETYFSHGMLETGVAERVPTWEYAMSTAFHRLDNNESALRRALFGIRIKRPLFYCLNDDIGELPNPIFVAQVQKFLEGYYPNKSSFES